MFAVRIPLLAGRDRHRTSLPLFGGILKYNLIFIGIALSLLSGCAVTQPQKVPRDVLRLTDSEFNRDYFVYIPSGFGNGKMPLIVTCHGTNPWDSARMQIDEWKYLAEKNKCVVIAPQISSARGFLPPGESEGIHVLMEDEKFILKIIQRFLNHPAVDKRATMITGWSAGGFATYFVGMRHPDIFRVIVSRQANFIREYYPKFVSQYNPYQPTLIFYGTDDLPLLKADSIVAHRFLRQLGQKNVFLKALPGGHSRHPELAMDFFKQAVKIYPRPTILSAKIYSNGRCKIKFDSSLVGKVDAENVFWDFGDGESAPGVTVEHIYPKPGNYELTVMHTVNKQTIKFSGIINVDAGGLKVKPEVKK